MPPKPKGKGRNSKGVALSASPIKPLKKAVVQNQVIVPLLQYLDETVTEEPGSSQVWDQLETMMHMLLDLSSRFQAIEDGLEERRENATACILNPVA